MASTQTMIDLYELGNSTYKIAKVVGLTPASVYSRLKNAGVKIRTKKESLQYLVKYNTCVVCGKEFRARAAWGSGSLYRTTCGGDCEFKLRSEKSKDKWTDERKQQMSELFTGRDTAGFNFARGDRKPNWRGGLSSVTYNKIVFGDLGFEKKCEICGAETKIVVHHIDRDRTNNTPENIKILCRGCHAQYHCLAGDCGLNGKNGYNTRGLSKSKITESSLWDLYWGCGLSIVAVGKELGYNRATIKNKMVFYGIPTRR